MKLEQLVEGRYFISDKERALFSTVITPGKELDGLIWKVKRGTSTILDNNKFEARLRVHPNQPFYIQATANADKQLFSISIKFVIPEDALTSMYDGEDDELKAKMQKLPSARNYFTLKRTLHKMLNVAMDLHPVLWLHRNNNNYRTAPRHEFTDAARAQVLAIYPGEFNEVEFFWKRNHGR